MSEIIELTEEQEVEVRSSWGNVMIIAIGSFTLGMIMACGGMFLLAHWLLG